MNDLNLFGKIGLKSVSSNFLVMFTPLTNWLKLKLTNVRVIICIT